MFGLGFLEIAVILVVALLLLGPERLPKVAGQLARALRDIRSAASDFQSSITIDHDVNKNGEPPKASLVAEKTPSPDPASPGHEDIDAS